MRFVRHLPKLHARRLATAATRDGLVLWGHPRFRSGRVVWMLGELGVLDIDIDAIFKIEKADKSWMPAQRAWYNAREWA